MYVLMVVPSDFPNGDAGAVRDDAFAQIYKELGYEVKLVGKGKYGLSGEFNGTVFVSIYREITGIKGHVDRFLFDKKKYKQIISGWINQYGPPSVIHINHIPEETINYLISIANHYMIPIVHDSVEWYSACEFPYGKWDKAYILKDRLNRKIIRNPIKVYSISSYLDCHFKERGIRSVRIPVIMDVNNTKRGIINSSGKIKLIYAGSPATKDYLKEMVLGVEMLSEDNKARIEFNILGATEKQVILNTGLSKLSSCIKPYGRVSREEVSNKLNESDFAILLRPSEERYAQAGFPTKSVEAMSHGVAMLCNISSDLGMYLMDGVNAIIVNDHQPESLKSALERLLHLSRNQINEIKKQARLTAEHYFDYRLYIDDIKDFLELRRK